MLVDGNKIIEADEELSETFNKAFVRKIANLRENINTSSQTDPFQYLRTHMSQRLDVPQFSIHMVTEQTVSKHIKKLKNTSSYGCDGIPTHIVKTSIEVLLAPITRIINSSISQGKYPDSWKLGTVIPIHKKGSKKEVGNYRPVSLLPVVSKVLESVINSQIMYHVEKYELLPNSQHGFRPKRSTTSALLSLTTHWDMNLKKHKFVGALMLDLSAAFDTLSADILCEKLEILRFDKTTVDWIKSYMTGRRQKTRMGNTTSTPIEVTVGTPQGGILSPLLFSLYITDIELWTDSFVSSYADDMTITLSSDSLENLKLRLAREAEKLLSYMASNFLGANAQKTEFLLMSRGNKHLSNEHIEIGNSLIYSKDSVKLLGLNVSASLT